MCVPLACIGVSRYVLQLHSLLADNIASNVVGLVLGTIVRFLLYKFWVYSPRRTAVRLGDVDPDGRIAEEVSSDPLRRSSLARSGSQNSPGE
jgi:hypothetical protein